MLRISLNLLIGLLVLLLVAGCYKKAPHSKVEPASKEKLESGLYRLTLTERAVERLDVKTSEISRGADDSLEMPYSALIYDLYGNTWAYTSPEPRVYVREAVEVDLIEGDRVIMTRAPEPGTLVVSVGAAELYGEETGIGK